MIVILDSGDNPGKYSPGEKLLEKDWNLDLIGRIERDLDNLEIRHYRTTDISEELDFIGRCKYANHIASENPKSRCIFISFHLNSAGDNGKWLNSRGWSVWVNKNASSNSRRLASYLKTHADLHNLKVKTPLPGQPYWEAGFPILRGTSMPAVLIKNAYLDNKEDVAFLKTKEGKETFKNIIIGGIKDYFGV